MSNAMLEKVANDSAITGFGSHSVKEVEELQKALSISQNYGSSAPNTLVGGSALSVEDLDRTLKIVTYGLEHLKLWKDIIKEKVTQAVGEFNVQGSYGAEVSPFFAMGGNPTATDADYNRQIYQVKYLGVQAQVQHNLTLIQAAHGPVVAREVKNKTVELLGKNERALFEADSSINALEYDGIFAQIVEKEALSAFKSTAFAGYDEAGVNDSVIIDSRAMFDEEVAEDAALMNANNFGMAMDMYIGTDVHSKFSKAIYNRQRTVPGAVITSGQRIKEHSGTLDYRFKPSLFCRGRKSPLAVAVSASAAPTTAGMASPADAASEFAAADAGNYSYRISAVYSDGETLASIAEGFAVSAGDKVTDIITYAGSPLYFNVFRAPVGTVLNHKFIGRIAASASGATYNIDYNSFLPGADKAYLLMNDPDVLVFKQLGSLIKYDLAVTDTSYKWLQLMYGTPLISAARKCVVVKNIVD
jgi:hypothetical protein